MAVKFFVTVSAAESSLIRNNPPEAIITGMVMGCDIKRLHALIEFAVCLTRDRCYA
jgi:hypothetical protein